MVSMVSWNPDIETLRATFMAMRDQGVEAIFVNDNNSKSEIKEALKELADAFPGFVTITWNKENGGMGLGLNPGVRAAMERGAEWVMTIEDDNAPEPGMIKSMFDAYDALSPGDRVRVGTIAPNLSSPRGLAFPPGPAYLTEDGAITSGEIVKTDVYRKIGLYNELLFIDYVDGEFCCRVYQAGFVTLRVPNALLKHRLGHPTTKRFLWKTALVPNYPPLRYYFMARNSIWLYLWNFRIYILHNNHWYDSFWALIIPRYLIKVVLFEDHKSEKIRMAFRGATDGLLRRMDRDWARARAHLAP